MSKMSLQGNLSYKEEKAIEELQMRMKNYLTPGMLDDEFFYYRFLKARDFDVDKAEHMIRNHITWRKVYQIDTILEDFTPEEAFIKYLEPGILGFDKEGNIVVYEPFGRYKPSEVFKGMKINDLWKHWFYFGEKNLSLLKKENERTGRNAYRGIIIADFDKMSLATVMNKTVADFLLQLLMVYQDNYPERLKYFICINVPPYFVLLFSIIKRVMSSEVLSKIQVFKNSGWKEKLLEIIDADVLPAFLGGNRTDPDGNPLCTSFINQGGRLPKQFVLSDEDRYFKDLSQVKKLNIPAMQSEQIRVTLTELGSLLKWEFLLKSKNIGFGIFSEVSEVERVEIIPIQKYETPDGCERGSYKCRTPGNYIVVFDNTYSWMHSKEVKYRLEVVKPQL